MPSTELARAPGKAKCGVLKVWLEALAQLGWRWGSPLVVRNGRADELLHLRDAPPAKLQREGRESLRGRALRELALRRASFRGFENKLLLLSFGTLNTCAWIVSSATCWREGSCGGRRVT